MDIKVYKNGMLEQELSLSSGTYLMGRSSNCDIVLGEKNISRKHARLVIGETESTIEDLGSSNGVLVNGARITKQKFNDNLSVVIGCFTVLLQPAAEKKQEKAKISSGNRLLMLVGGRPRFSAVLSMLLLYVVCVFGGLTLAGNFFETLFNHQEQERAVLIAKSLVEVNSPFWSNSDVTKFRIEAFEKEEGVVQVLLADTYGRILAPIDKVNHTINHALFALSLKSGTVEVATQENQEIFISYPVREGANVLGAAVLTYRMRPYESVTPFNWWELYGLLGVLFIIAVILARILVQSLMAPWKQLAVDAGMAIRNGYDRLATTARYSELDDIKNLFERLLTRSSMTQIPVGAKIEKPVITSTPRPATVDRTIGGGATRSGDPMIALTAQAKAACLVDLESHQVIRSTPPFQTLFQVAEPEMCHILEVFQDEEMLQAIMGILEGRMEKSEVFVSGSPCRVSVRNVPDAKTQIVLIFER